MGLTWGVLGGSGGLIGNALGNSDRLSWLSTTSPETKATGWRIRVPSLSFGHFGSVAVYFQGHPGDLAVKPENQVHLPNRGNIKALQPTHP